MSPSEIARSTKLKPNIARARLSELRKKGEVQRKFRGYYECNPTYDVGFHTPPRVQNLRVTAKEVPITVSDVYERVVRNLRIRITFGVKRGKISYTVKASKGLDLDGLRLCHALVNTECEVRG